MAGINLSSLPKKQKLIYLLTLEDKLFKDFKFNDYSLKLYKYKQNYNIYRYDKFLDERIKPNHFFYYYKDNFYRNKLSHSKIDIIERLNDDEWIEERTILDKKFKIKIMCDNYQMVGYIIEDDIPTFELFIFKIREMEHKYMLRLEMAFNAIDLEQEVELKNEIILVNKLENVILQNIK